VARDAIDPGPRYRRVLPPLLVSIALLTVAAMTLRDTYLVTTVVEVPSVVGSTVPEAVARLADAGLTATVVEETDPAAPAGRIFRQLPPAGTTLRPGRAVAVRVNVVHPQRPAPDLVGMREREAKQRAEREEIRIAAISYAVSDYPAGSVAAQEPQPGTLLAGDAALTLVISRGPERAAVEVPDLLGLPIDEAVAAAAALGFRQIERVSVPVSGAVVGTVTDQRPGAGLALPPTTPLVLVHAVEGADLVAVPDLTGLTVPQASVELVRLGLVPGAVRAVEDPNLPPGIVATRPAGTTLRGSPIALIVNDPNPIATPFEFVTSNTGPLATTLLPDDPATPPVEVAAVPAPGTTRIEDDGARVIPFRFDPAEQGIRALMNQAYHLQLLLVDALGERVVYDERLPAGQRVEIPVRIVGDDPLLQTFIDGSFYQAWRP
jgi:beta-lactam-binding protein with PASTA domain